MNRISSSGTFVSKWLFPIAWFGFLVYFVAEAVLDGTAGEEPVFLLAPMFMAIIGLIFMRYLVWDLADVVEDYGTYLLVKRRSEEERVPLENIMNVSSTTMVNPPRVTLRLIQPGTFGSNISFTPKASFSLNPFAKNVVAENLMERAYRARTASRHAL